MSRDGDRPEDHSDSGSFHASVWEEERTKRSLVKWAGEESLDRERSAAGPGLRRAPTPFPKEMRAMAKKVASMKEQRRVEEEAGAGRRRGPRHRHGRPRQQADPPADPAAAVGPVQAQATSPVPAPVDEQVGDTVEPVTVLRVSDTATAPPAPVPAQLVTCELDRPEESRVGPPPYHIAASRSRHAAAFPPARLSQPAAEPEHFYENSEQALRRGGAGLERRSSLLSNTSSNFESISESEASTAPSSLQTIVRAPYALQAGEEGVTLPLGSAPHLRRVSEQLLLSSAGRSRGSLSGRVMVGQDSRPGSVSFLPLPGPAQSSSGSSSGSRPASQLSNSVQAPPPGPASPAPASCSTSRIAQLAAAAPGREARPNSFAVPPNTVGLPVGGAPSSPHSPRPRPALSPVPFPESNGLLSTISQVISNNPL